jgi:hypothetical protein
MHHQNRARQLANNCLAPRSLLDPRRDMQIAVLPNKMEGKGKLVATGQDSASVAATFTTENNCAEISIQLGAVSSRIHSNN